MSPLVSTFNMVQPTATNGGEATEAESTLNAEEPQQQQQKLRPRLEMGGDRGKPAARVVNRRRPVPSSRGSGAAASIVPIPFSSPTARPTTASKRVPSSVGSQQVEPNQTTTSCLGAVMERTSRRRRPSSSSAQKNGTTGVHAMTAAAAPSPLWLDTKKTGMPTVYRSLGTFRPKKSSATSSSSQLTHSSAADNSVAKAGKNTTTTTSEQHQEQDKLRHASVLEADNLLAALSETEVQGSIQELTALLDPATLAFLKQRGQRHSTSALAAASTTATTTTTTTTTVKNTNAAKFADVANATIGCPDPPIPSTAVTDVHAPPSRRVEEQFDPCLPFVVPEIDQNDEAEKRRRMAHVLSSIRTLDELDDAYRDANQRLQSSPSSENELKNINTVAKEDEFPLACQLLRSSSPAQSLWACRVVYNRLRAVHRQKNAKRFRLRPMMSNDHDDAEEWPFPILLPVSLRCLLDSTFPLSGGSMMQSTYVLQSLDLLCQLRACTDHVVDLTVHENNDFDENDSDAVIFQRDCLDDAVPTLPLSSCYASAPSLTTTENDTVDLNSSSAAYAVTLPGSSTGAKNDGEEFIRDPLWTLLARMRVIPCLAQLLRHGHRISILEERDFISEDSNQEKKTGLLPPELLTAVCGILAMAGQRSPGAASAIVNHPTMMNDLVGMTLIRADGSARFDPHLATPTIRLFCTLSRQTREAAEGLCCHVTESSSFLLQVLGRKATTNPIPESRNSAHSSLQQWTLILWRTFLRYELALDICQSVLVLASPHLVPEIQHSPSYVLLPELYSCFAIGVFASRARPCQKETDGLDGACPDDTNNDLAAAWGPSLKRQALRHLTLGNANTFEAIESLRVCSSIIRYFAASISTNASSKDYLAASVDPLAEEDSAFLKSLFSIIQSSDMLDVCESALRSAFMPCFPGNLFLHDSFSRRKEASACSFVCALISSVLVTKHMTHTTDGLHQDIPNMVGSLRQLLLSILEPVFRGKGCDFISSTKDIFLVDTARRRWLNGLHASAATFLSETSATSGIDQSICRAMAHSILGRLDRGDESTAVQLLSVILQKEKALPHMSVVLHKELRSSLKNRYQLDHSMQLHFPPGSLQREFSGVALRSLRSESDAMLPEKDGTDHLLPIGKYWLWKLLSNATPFLDQAGKSQWINVILETLNAIETFDECNFSDIFTRAGLVSVGPKLYYISNICLQTESVLSHEWIRAKANVLLDQYFLTMASNDVIELAHECSKHLDPLSRTRVFQSKRIHDLTDEEKLMTVLEPSKYDGTPFSPAVLRALESFVQDLCDSFLRHGADFPFFAKCLRVFLAAGFPSKIRCIVIQRLHGVLHLLTLDDDGDLLSLLPHFFTGGMPHVDNSYRDSPELLDAIANVYCKGTSMRPDDSFFASWSIGMLARNLAINVSMASSSGKSVNKLRLETLEPRFASRVMQVCLAWLSTTGTVKELTNKARYSSDRNRYAQEDTPDDDQFDWTQALAGLHVSARTSSND